jgi:hypothetical protein
MMRIHDSELRNDDDAWNGHSSNRNDYPSVRHDHSSEQNDDSSDRLMTPQFGMFVPESCRIKNLSNNTDCITL